LFFYFSIALRRIFLNHHPALLSKLFLLKPITMQEKQRIITVIIVVLLYNLVDQFLLRRNNGIDIWSVGISVVIAFVLYLILIYFFGKKHVN